MQNFVMASPYVQSVLLFSGVTSGLWGCWTDFYTGCWGWFFQSICDGGDGGDRDGGRDGDSDKDDLKLNATRSILT